VYLYVRLVLKASETSAFHLRVGDGTERNHLLPLSKLSRRAPMGIANYSDLRPCSDITAQDSYSQSSTLGV
jgi:hypothetical protein